MYLIFFPKKQSGDFYLGCAIFDNLVGIFGLVAFGLRERATSRERWRDLVSFAAGLALVALPAAAVGGWILVRESGPHLDLAYRAAQLTHLLGVWEAYAIAALPLGARTAPVMNSACLALWAAALAWISGPPTVSCAESDGSASTLTCPSARRS